MPEEKVELTPEMIAAIMAQNASRPQNIPTERPNALAPSQNDIPKMISEKPFAFSSPDPEMEGHMTAFGAQSAPLTPFSAPEENPLNLLSPNPVEAPAPVDLLEHKRVDIVAGPFAIGSFSPPPPVSPPVEKLIPVVQPVVPVVKPKAKRRKKKANISQINVSRSK